MRCPSCGNENRPGARFCDGCGAPAGEPAAAREGPRPAVPLPASFAEGRYQVRSFLGEGGKKRVYLAHDTRLERDVAIAVVKADGLDEAGLARVHREARAMGRLGDHPNVVTVYDVIEEEGRPLIVCQFMAGGSVNELLRREAKQRLPLDRALRLADEVCRALEHAHARGIVHRDLKPSNVWLSEDGTAQLGDFGLALALDRSRITLEGMMVGTVAYMSPEQALGQRADARSDLYSLGAMLYEMLTGRPPFLGDDAVAVISQHINTPPVAPSWHNPEVPSALEALILRLLAKAPERRPEGAGPVRQALAAIEAGAARPAAPAAPEELNPLDRLAGGVFVGREKEMDQLRAGLEETLSGHGRLLLLVGEPGIGKTRTAEELVTYARLRKAQVLWGRCYEGEGAPAFWPWVQAIRSYAHERDPKLLLSELGSGASDIAQVVSEVREKLPGLPAPPPLEPEQARFRLFDGIATFLRNAGRAQPLVIVLDDLHWADRSSLLLLQFVARELRDARVLLLCAYRDTEMSRHHPLSQALGELAREQLSQRVLLRGLGEGDVARFIEMTAGLAPPRPLVESVYRATEGNPFFVNEVVRLLVSEGRLDRPQGEESWSVEIPEGVRSVIGRRLDRLSAECNRVLTVASVIGREFELSTLARVAELSEDRLLDLLDEALAARVVAERPGALGRYAFAHALVRETLSEELTATRRARLHGQIGEVLEALHGARPEAHLAELAHHFFEAARGGADAQKAVDYAVRAGERASAVFAYDEAVVHYERALQALELRSPADERRRCELLLALGEARDEAGNPAAAKEIFLTTAELARGLGDAELLARAALRFVGQAVGIVEIGKVDQQLIALLEEALAALGEGDSAIRARLLARLAMELYFLPGSETRRAVLSQEAVEMARRLGDTATYADTLRARHMACWGPDDAEERAAVAAEIVELGEQGGNRLLVVVGRFWRMADLLELGDVAALDAELEAFAAEAGKPNGGRFAAWGLALHRVMRALLEGRLDEVEQLASQAQALGQKLNPETANLALAVQLATLYRYRGRLGEIEGALAVMAQQYPSIPGFRWALPYISAHLGREDEARERFELLAAADFADLPRDAFWLANLYLIAEACVLVGDARRAAILYDLCRPFEGRVLVHGFGAVCWGSGARLLGPLAALLRRWPEAEAHFEAALECSRRLRALPDRAFIELDYARMLLERNTPGDRAKALGLLGACLETARALGMKPTVERAVALRLRAQGIGSTDLSGSIDAVDSRVREERPDLRPHAAPDGTVTILFTDLEGSTAMTERLGDARAQELLREHNRIVREQVRVHQGFEVKSMGDGFMVAFRSAGAALRSAIGMERAFAAYAATHPEEPLRVRIGLHTGEPIREADDFFGRTVIVAARIAALAEGGEILVSALLRELVGTAGEFAFGEERKVELKGLSAPCPVFPVAF